MEIFWIIVAALAAGYACWWIAMMPVCWFVGWWLFKEEKGKDRSCGPSCRHWSDGKEGPWGIEESSGCTLSERDVSICLDEDGLWLWEPRTSRSNTSEV